MAFKNQSRFTAKIEGVDVYSIKSMINYKIDSLEDRMKCVDTALEHGDKFYMDYFDEYCDTALSSEDMLLSESNVVQSLESMANYILAKDPEYNKTEDSYFVNETELTRKAKKEDEFNGTDSSVVDGLEVSSEPVEVKNNSNFKKLKRQKITPADLKRNDELGEVLRDYNTFLELISRYTKKNNGVDGERIKHLPGKKAELHVYTGHQSNVKDDMIICKDSMMRTHGYNLKNFGESTQPDYSVIDLTNKEHLLGSWVQYSDTKVKSNGLLSFEATDDYQDDFNCILIDVQNLVNKCDLNEFEIDVLELYKSGSNIYNIAKGTGSNNRMIERTLGRIADKVIVEAEKQIKKN